MGNRYLEKIAESISASASSTTTSSSSSGANNTFNVGKAGIPNGTQVKGFRSLRMGSHTTPDDLLPNPQKMDIRVK